MVELSNGELRAMAANMVPKIRDLCASYRQRVAQLRIESSSPTKRKQEYERERSIGLEVTEQYQKTLRADQTLLTNELLRRLDSKVAAGVIRVPFLRDTETGTPLSLSLMLGISGNGPIDAGLMCVSADETEQLAKLLPAAETEPRH